MSSKPPTIIATSIGSLAKQYPVGTVKVVKNSDKNPYEGQIDKTSTRDKELYKSSLGTPVYTDLTLRGGSYTDQNGRTITFEDITFVTILMVVSQAKKIVRTEIQGRNGTVKEYIGLDDYKVTINGIITGPNGHYPVDEVRSLKDILDAPVPIEVISDYLRNLDIHSLVVDDYTFDQEPGGYSKQNFTINCSSDEPLELQIQ